jgi:hypothetical protein
MSSGSIIAISGTKLLWRNERLKLLVPVVLSTAFLVASLPVPAVVGIAINGILTPP